MEVKNKIMFIIYLEWEVKRDKFIRIVIRFQGQAITIHLEASNNLQKLKQAPNFQYSVEMFWLRVK
jgi:hypothetical protein